MNSEIKCSNNQMSFSRKVFQNALIFFQSRFLINKIIINYSILNFNPPYKPAINLIYGIIN